ncbi:glutathione S-transferase T3-like [Raphanus sativus]|uniref:Glutathione S-transferase T3-like n=1 Tax=Raphanus sativus TaxID=3726 RepID=A0A9W3CYA7_RAPSA|nr:glutathione S-transferase T3-like [Raphanus sativus]XP_056856575.1 glutathione S-transferase T3-like [Raphanus sativus]
MDYNPYTSGYNYTDLLLSQQTVIGSSEVPASSSQQNPDCNHTESPVERRERRKWTVSDDILLISAWLNTSKDPITGNEQRAGAFWGRISAYFEANHAEFQRRESLHCKHRWQKINEGVCRFCGSYDAAVRAKTSGQNDTDVLKIANDIYFNRYKKKFNLDHAWRELRYDQKWCSVSSSKEVGSSKKRKLDDGTQSETSQATESKTSECHTRPPGVKAAKAAKARGKKPEGKDLDGYQKMWSIRKEDMAMKEKLYKMSLLDNLIAKKDTLSESEEGLKDKLIAELYSA